MLNNSIRKIPFSAIPVAIPILLSYPYACWGSSGSALDSPLFRVCCLFPYLIKSHRFGYHLHTDNTHSSLLQSFPLPSNLTSPTDISAWMVHHKINGFTLPWQSPTPNLRTGGCCERRKTKLDPLLVEHTHENAWMPINKHITPPWFHRMLFWLMQKKKKLFGPPTFLLVIRVFQ